MPEYIVKTTIGQQRKKRIKKLKRVILITLIFSIIIPFIMCIVLLFKISRLENQVNILKDEISGKINEDVMQIEDNHVVLQEELLSDGVKLEEAEQLNTDVGDTKSDDIRKIEDQRRKVYLTFDDGPSSNTASILDILEEYGVKATFFVVGKEEKQFLLLYQRIVEDGHTLGMHSYSHKYKDIYATVESFADDLIKLQDYLFEITGVKCTLYRFPGGSSNTVSNVEMKELIQCLKENGIMYFDWNISSKDATSPSLTTRQIADNVINSIKDYKNAVVLLHDSADKNTTVEALPIIIERILEMDNTVILPITEDTIPVQHIKME
ncbi:MAG TPA: polysaccharide deacetylase family protein [Lachnospiraceae bacterium]|nr:polysaccharide deacetylase family protein [Lachnospiraceae bacterium]